MAIFTSLAEHDKVFEIIEKKGCFEDLSEMANASIDGMYDAIDELKGLEPYCENGDSTTGIESVDKLLRDVFNDAIEKAVKAIEMRIAESYVYFKEEGDNEDD